MTNDEVIRLLKEALEKAERGKTLGIAIIEIVSVSDGKEWAIDTRYWGPLLCILAGSSQLAHSINEKAKQIST